jgi:hypothetical protein
MKGKIVFQMACLLIFFTSFAFAEEYDFRQTKWGMTKEEVKSSESSQLLTDINDILEYKTSIFDYVCKVYYYFEDGRLRSAEYDFGLFDLMENAKYVYNFFEEILTNKYGILLDEEKLEKWDDIMRLESGEIPEKSYQETRWENNTTLIILKINDYYCPSIFICYFDKKWLEENALKRAKEREQALYEAF